MTTCTASTASFPTSATSSRTTTACGPVHHPWPRDHIGAIPYVLKQVSMPIYCTRFTAGLIKLKLQEHRLLDSTKIITVEPGSVRAGKFR